MASRLPCRAEIRVGALLFLITVAVYAPVFSNGFVGFDDRLYVTQNPHVRSGITAEGVSWAFETNHTGNWHPLTWLSHMLDVELFGLRPGPHHLSSAMLHALNALLLFLALRRATASVWRSALVAALFALHPLHVESVAWAAERKDVLCALFWILSMWAYLVYGKTRRLRSYLLALFLFALGLLAKPMIVTLPFVLLLLDVWPLGRLRTASTHVGARPIRLLLEKTPFLVLSAVVSAVTVSVQRGGGNVTAAETLPLANRVGNALVSYVVYVKRAIWPQDLAFFYPHPVDVPTWALAGAFLLLAAATALVIREAGRRPYLLVGWLWYLGTLVPVIGLIQVGRQAGADRYTYLPLVGLFLMFAWGLEEFVQRTRASRRLVGAVVAAALVATVALTVVQIGYWRDSETLYRHALDVTTDNYVALDLMGSALARQGRIDEAISYHVEALRIAPRFAGGHNNLGNALFLQGDLDGALRHYGQAVNARPDFGEAHYNLGIVQFQLGRREKAADHFREAVRFQPEHRDAHYNLAVVLGLQGRGDEALIHYRIAVRLDPHDPELHYALGNALLGQGRVEDAIASYFRALEIKPDFAAARAKLDAAAADLEERSTR